MNTTQRAAQEAQADLRDGWVKRELTKEEALAVATAAASQAGEGEEWVEAYVTELTKGR